MPGPPPKRSSQRRRRNKPETPTTTVKATGEVTVRDGEPPRTGRGSSTAAWRTYAERLGIDVPAGAKRGDIIALVDEHDAGDESWHPLARDWYRSLASSAQCQFYEASDWATAKILAELLSKALASGKVTAALIERWQVGATELLTTEGARRRARVELERAAEDGEEAGADVSELEQYRRRAQARAR
jgi:TPR repeat protein